MHLFHFSEDPAIEAFEPRPLRVPVDRGPDRDWLNGPLVWAIDGEHALLYLFPRECPRILVWPTPRTTAEDREAWFGGLKCRAIAYVEDGWLGRLRAAVTHRYRLPAGSFEPVGEIGMWVSRRRVLPLGVDALTDLPAELEAAGVELRSLPRLSPLKPVWGTTLHASGIRTRNAIGWGPAGWEHSKPGRTGPAADAGSGPRDHASTRPSPEPRRASPLAVAEPSRGGSRLGADTRSGRGPV